MVIIIRPYNLLIMWSGQAEHLTFDRDGQRAEIAQQNSAISPIVHQVLLQYYNLLFFLLFLSLPLDLNQGILSVCAAL